MNEGWSQKEGREGVQVAAECVGGGWRRQGWYSTLMNGNKVVRKNKRIKKNEAEAKKRKSEKWINGRSWMKSKEKEKGEEVKNDYWELVLEKKKKQFKSKDTSRKWSDRNSILNEGELIIGEYEEVEEDRQRSI